MPAICLDCRYIRPQPSGIGEVVRALIDYLPDLAPDLQFKLLRHPKSDGPFSNAPNVTEMEVRAEPNGPASMWWLPQIADLRGIDLFHAPSNILPRGLTMPCVTTIHDVMWLTDPQLCNPTAWGHIERHFYRHGIRRALQQSDAISTVSEATRAAIIALKPELAERTHAALSGVSKAFRPREVEREELQRLGLGDRPYILVVGQNAPYKNHEGAIRGFAKAFSKHDQIDLAFVHRRGASSDRLRRLAGDLGLATRVYFLRPVQQRDLITLYIGAAALLHPSFIEGFGMPLAEAMACGCPVVTSNCSAMLEVTGGPEVTGGAALLVDPRSSASIAEALKRVTHDRELANTMRSKGLVRARELNWRSFAEANLDIYRRVLSGS